MLVLETVLSHLKHTVFSHGVPAAILGSQRNQTAAMLVAQTNPVGVELFSNVNTFLSQYLPGSWPREWNHSLKYSL